MEVYKQFKKDLTWIIVITFALALLRGIFDIGTDDSDYSSFYRSGVAVRIDALTGCQYLEGNNGGLTPRLDYSGKQIGCRS